MQASVSACWAEEELLDLHSPSERVEVELLFVAAIVMRFWRC